MISWLWPRTNPSTPSNACCNPPGDSTDSRERTSRNRISRKPKTRSSIENEFEMGAVGYFGSMWSIRKKAVTGEANKWLRIAVNQSCSCIKQLQPLAPSLFPGRAGILLLPTSYCNVRLVHCFAGDGPHGQEQAHKQPPKARRETG